MSTLTVLPAEGSKSKDFVCRVPNCYEFFSDPDERGNHEWLVHQHNFDIPPSQQAATQALVAAQAGTVNPGQTVRSDGPSAKPKHYQLARGSENNLSILHEAQERVSGDFGTDGRNEFRAYFVGVLSNYVPAGVYRYAVEQAEKYFREARAEKANGAV